MASQIVQVTSDAKARPIITAFTTMSAAMNMPQGDRSCGSMAIAGVLAAAASVAGSGGWAALGGAIPICGAAGGSGFIGPVAGAEGSEDIDCPGDAGV